MIFNNLERTKKWAFFGVTALVFSFGVTADAQPTNVSKWWAFIGL
jgi:hypothetical protein